MMLSLLSVLSLFCLLAVLQTSCAFPSLRDVSAVLHPKLSSTPFRPTQAIRNSFERILRLCGDRLESESSDLSYAHHPPPRTASLDEIVLRFNVTTEQEVASLAEASDILFLDVWEFSKDWVDIRITHEVVPSLLGLLPESLHRAHSPILDTRALTRAIAQSYPSHVPFETSHRSSRQLGTDTYAAKTVSVSNQNVFFDEYRPLAVMEPWMLLLESLNPSWVSVVDIGKSYEGRDIRGLRVGLRSQGAKLGARRKTILVMGGAHAREWISTSTVNFIAYSLIQAFGKDREATKLVQDFDWIFVPSINPDGYAYTWETDRLWRKNRQPTSLRFCRGIDLDRTWNYMWDGNHSSNPCSGSYAGEVPFEGVEARRVADWARNQTDNNNVDFVGLLDLHSYSQQILYPYSFSCSTDPPTLEDLEELGEGLAKAFRLRHYHYYTVIPACEGNVFFDSERNKKVLLPMMEGNGGSALDYFYRVMNVRHSFQIKLRDTGSYGFLLPKEYIIPTGEETFEALKYLGKSLHDDQVWDPYHGGYLRNEAGVVGYGRSQQSLT